MSTKKEENEKLWTRDFIILLVMSFCNLTSMQFITSVVALWVDSLGLSSNYTGIFTMCFTLPCIAGCLLWGRISQYTGRRILLILGSILFGITSFILPFTGPAIAFIVVLRIVQGIGYSAINNGMAGTQADVITPGRLGEGIGYFGMVQTLTLVIGPAVALAITNNFGFTPTFLSMTGMCIVIFFGAVILKVDISAAAIKESARKELAQGTETFKGLWKFLEKGAIFPCVILLVSMSAFSSVNFYVTTYVADIGFGNASLFFIIYAVVEIIVINFIKKLSDKFSMLTFMIPGAVLSAVGLFILSLARDTVVLFVAAAIVGAGTAMIIPISQTAAFRGVSMSRRGMASATYYIAFDGGMCIGSVAWGYVVDFAGFRSMYKCAALVFIALCLFCIIYATIKSVHKERVIGRIDNAI